MPLHGCRTSFIRGCCFGVNDVKIILFANTDWYLFNFRLPMARVLKAQGHDVMLISPYGDYGARFCEAGFRWEPLAMERRSLNPFREILVLIRLALLYRREQPDVVHHFTVKCVVYGAAAAAFARIPARINAVAGLGYVFSNNSLKARLLRPLVRGLMRWSLNNAQSRLILQNPDDVKAFTLAGIVDAPRVHLIRSSGVDTHRFQPTGGAVGSGQPTIVLLAARLLWDKGIAEYVQAARKLHGAGLPIRFLLAGAPDHGNPASVRQDELDAWAAEGVVEPLGHVDDMREQLANTDIMVLPSYYGEGVPRSLIEAAACGLPIVTTDSPGCREVVTDGVDGLLIPVRNSEALAGAIQRLHENPIFRSELGAAARQRALAEFDERIVIEKTLVVYHELLSGLKQSEV
jgi:glycosyltransferase involved in cell wall biosynthesis